MQFKVNLGGTAYDERAGALYISQSLPGAILSTPRALHYSRILPEVEPVTNALGWLRQLKTPEVLADIVTNSAFNYSIRMFTSNNVGAKIDGVYQVLNEPFVTYTIENPNGAVYDYNTLRVTETGGAAPIVNVLTWEPENSRWTLSKGNGLWTERMQVYWTNPTTTMAIYDLLNPTNGLPYYTATITSQAFPWGEELIEKRYTAGSEEWVATYTYWENETDNGYGKLKQVTQPSGAWQSFEPDVQGRTARVFSSFLNQAFTLDPNLCRVTEWDYTTLPAGSGDNGSLKPNTPRRVIESLKGVEVSRTYCAVSIESVARYRCQTRGSAWNASDNLKTTTTYYTTGNFTNEVWKVKNPDGTMQFYTYSTNGTVKTTVVASGQPNGGETDITDGTRTMTVTSLTGQTLSTTIVDNISGATIDSAIYSNFDDLGRAATVTYLDGIVGYRYDCCGLAAVTNRDGTVTSYSYDDLKRRMTETANGISLISNYDMRGMVLSTVRQGTDSSPMTLTRSVHDGFGRVTASVNALDNSTGYEYSRDGSSQAVITTTYPNLGTRIETYAQDGTLVRLSGTAVFPVRHEYGVESDGGVFWAYHKEIKLDAAGADTLEWTKTYLDMVNREFRTYYAKASAPYPLSQSFYNNAGQLWKQVDPDNVTRLVQYNAKGEPEYDVLDMNRDGIVDFNGPDRITRTLRDVVANYGTYVRRTQIYVYTNDTTSATLLASTVETSADGLRTWTTRAGATSVSESVYNGGGFRTLTRRAPDQSSVVTVYQGDRIQSVTRLDANGGQLSQTTYGYDAHGRQQTVTDARIGTSTYTYTAADLVESVTTPPLGDGTGPQTTTSYYDAMLRVWKVVSPDATSLTNEYYQTGTLNKTYGSRTYPVEYTYDPQGRVKTMITWQNYGSGTGAATTTWNYDPCRGFLTSKLDNNGKGPINTYTTAGRLSRIDRARAGQYRGDWAEQRGRGIGPDLSYRGAGRDHLWLRPPGAVENRAAKQHDHHDVLQ